MSLAACKAQDINSVLNTVNNTVNGGSLSNDDVIKGLKEALKVGTNNSVASTSKVDGFYKNSLIKIPFQLKQKRWNKITCYWNGC